jgi:hypothetical protein
MSSYRIFFAGFWTGFHDKTNGVNEVFFLNLMKKVYKTENILVEQDIQKANILIENTQVTDSLLHKKRWVHTYLFSGESYCKSNGSEYTCVLRGERTHNNVINCPLFVPYLESSFNGQILNNIATEVPKKDCLILISNPGGSVRNTFCQKLEKKMNVTYAGNYKNNIGAPFTPYMISKEFLDYVKQFKFILSMENSKADTYITEKIIHGFHAGIVPVYWGSDRVSDYFNPERFLHVKGEQDIDSVIDRMVNMTDSEWLEIVRKPVYSNVYTIDSIARQVRKYLFHQRFSEVRQIYCLCNPEFEPERYKNLVAMFKRLKVSDDSLTFISPTYKHTITDDMMKRYVKTFQIMTMRKDPMRIPEISLFLNLRATLEDIKRNYSDPFDMFLILEADVFDLANVYDFQDLLQKVKNKPWSVIHVGGKDAPDGSPFCNNLLPYRKDINYTPLLHDAKEDLSQVGDSIRLFRHFNTRCTDSLLWSYKGVQQFLQHMQKENYYVPLDYYMSELTIDNKEFKHYWSKPSYFDQKSNLRIEQSSIQTW